MRKKILVIGGTSKVGKALLQKLIHINGDVEVIYTYNSNHIDSKFSGYKLDLSDQDSIKSFTDSLSSETFDGVVCFSSIYNQDSSFEQGVANLAINALNLLFLIKKLRINNNATVILFTDAGTQKPKKGYAHYTLSKDILASLVRIIPVELGISTLGIDMGPVVTDKKGEELVNFKKKSVVKVDNATSGLINLIVFLLLEENYFSAGSIIDFSGGTYLKR